MVLLEMVIYGRKIEKSIKLPGDLIQAIESRQRLKDYLIINRPEEDALGQIITAEFDLQKHSFIALRLFIEVQRLGVIDLFVKGTDRFSQEDAHLISQLREPFAIAMANALKHHELIDIKEKLISDNRYPDILQHYYGFRPCYNIKGKSVFTNHQDVKREISAARVSIYKSLTD